MRPSRAAWSCIRTAAAALAGGLVAGSAGAQAPAASPTPPPPATDIYLVAIAKDGRARADSVVRMTDWSGYDNQPAFTRDGRGVLFTSIREDGQADVYRYDIGSKTTARVTTSPEAEFSPTPLPDGSGLSVIRVERDGTQRLWRIPDRGEPSVLLADVKPVGYHAWIDPQTLVLFVLGTPPTLRLADRPSGATEVVAENVGRSLHRIPGSRSASYLSKARSPWTIERFRPAGRQKETIVAALDGSEDYAWTPDGRLLMAQGSQLFSFRPGKDSGFRYYADLGPAGVRHITRIAVSPAGDRLALVADQAPPAK